MTERQRVTERVTDSLIVTEKYSSGSQRAKTRGMAQDGGGRKRRAHSRRELRLLIKLVLSCVLTPRKPEQSGSLLFVVAVAFSRMCSSSSGICPPSRRHASPNKRTKIYTHKQAHSFFFFFFCHAMIDCAGLLSHAFRNRASC